MICNAVSPSFMREQQEASRGITRKHHKRSCNKKAFSRHDVRNKALQIYLASIDINWPSFQKMHSRPGHHAKIVKTVSQPELGGQSLEMFHFVATNFLVINCASFCSTVVLGSHSSICRFAPMKKLNACSQGGFQKLQLRILNDSETTCMACLALMQQQGFSAEKAKAAVDAALTGHPDRQDVKDNVEGAIQDGQETDKAEGALVVDHDDTIPNEEVDNSPEACYEWMKQHEPTISLLPPGSFNKAVPYRCLACRTKTQPHGRVGECKRLKLYMVKHFVGQHIRSVNHQNNLAKMQLVEQSRQLVPCMGICVSRPEAGNLYIFCREFGIWASHADFEGGGKHKYTFDANAGQWNIRSATCKQETPLRHGVEHHACDECQALCAAHGATWTWDDMLVKRGDVKV